MLLPTIDLPVGHFFSSMEFEDLLKVGLIVN